MVRTQSLSAHLQEKLKGIPGKPGIYLFKDKRGRVLYVGKSRCLRERVEAYFRDSPPSDLPKISRMIPQIADVEFIVCQSEFDALILENQWIKRFQPKYNTQLKDQKNFPYIKFTGELYPRIALVRKMQEDGGQYFGPYTNAKNVRKTIRFLEKTFQIRPCTYKLPSRRVKLCIYYQMGYCPGPCEGLITAEEYGKNVDRAIRFMKGKYNDVLEEIEEKMRKAARERKFEVAALFRDQWKALQHLAERRRILSTSTENLDVMGLVQKGSIGAVEIFHLREGHLVEESFFLLENPLGKPLPALLSDSIQRFYQAHPSIPHSLLVSTLPDDAHLIQKWLKCSIFLPRERSQVELLKKATENARIKLEEYLSRKEGKLDKKARTQLEDLSRVLNLGFLPRRVEAYDISDIVGKEAVGAKVSFYAGHPDKEQFRHYRIRTKQTPDDYAMMAEMLRRRFQKIVQGVEEEPDFILIDGGKGHLRVALRVMDEFRLSIPVAALAKKEEKVYVPEKAEPLHLKKNSPALLFLRKVRDEVHRFAISYHRKLREKKVLHPDDS
ncbi:MAG: excinuclease ABC subunit UvrC [bacterium JZ-2024 1]